MDRATERIERQIDREREMLRANLEELEDRVRAVVDWRRHFRTRPALWMGCALGGGLLIALATAPRTGGSRPRALHGVGEPPGIGEAPRTTSEHRRREISRAWRAIETALIGVAAAKLKDTLAQVLPGFREQLARREGSYVHDSMADPTQH